MGVMREFNRDSLGFIERAQREYGDIVWMRFSTCRPCFSIIPTMLSTCSRRIRKTLSSRCPCVRTFFSVWSAMALLTSQGEEWKRQRRLSQPAFHRERVAT